MGVASAGVRNVRRCVGRSSARRGAGKDGDGGGESGGAKLAIYHETLPGEDGLRYWLRDRVDGPRRRGGVGRWNCREW